MNDSSCTRLEAYLAGDLDQPSRAAFEKHLARCMPCAEEVRLQAKIDLLLASAQPLGPPDLQCRVAASIRRRRIQRIVQPAAAAAILVGCLIAGWRFRTGEPHAADARHAQNDLLPAGPRPRPEPNETNQIVIAKVEAPQVDRVQVDAGPGSIVISEPTIDPTIHIFWIYPAVNVSANAPDAIKPPLEPERNSS